MGNSYYLDKTFKNLKSLEPGDYENCEFLQCNFSNYSFKEINFIDCHFLDCNFSLSNFNQTLLQNIHFKDSKLTGTNFSNAKDFGLALNFENSQLNQSNFYRKNLKKTFFKKCQMQEIDFSEANLSEAIIEDSDLLNTIFDQTNLEKANFESAFNYRINPENNRIKKAIFSSNGLAGLLDKYDIQIIS